jgi:uncharacterized protein (TIGR02246 family)
MSADIERLLAYEEIRQLAARYAVAVDSRDVDAVVELFTPDVKVMGARGRDALRQLFLQHMRSDRVSILQVGTHVIDLVDADHATGIVYSTCEMGDERRWARQAIAYHDRYERHDGRWYFARRDHKLFYGVEVSERPLGQPDANWPARAIGRGSLPFEWPSWQHFWADDEA